MTTPYYADDQVTLYHGDCREITEWLKADILITDPPYGIGWTITAYNGGTAHAGIANDGDTSARDEILRLFGDRPSVMFGSPNAERPVGTKQTLVWAKPPDSGIFGAIAGFRRDWESIYLIGRWESTIPAKRSGVLHSQVGSLAIYTKRGHPHGKPIDLMEQLISACPPGVIADPFAGSGSTLVAARNFSRRAIGIEIEERYCEIAARRLSQGVFALDDGADVETLAAELAEARSA